MTTVGNFCNDPIFNCEDLTTINLAFNYNSFGKVNYLLPIYNQEKLCTIALPLGCVIQL